MEKSRPVYSTDGGRVNTREATPARPASPFPKDGVVRITRERGKRGGKTVTVVNGLPERGAALDKLATELKRLCGAGGTVKDGVIEVQGDHREAIAERLRALGYKVKLAGG